MFRFQLVDAIIQLNMVVKPVKSLILLLFFWKCCGMPPHPVDDEHGCEFHIDKSEPKLNIICSSLELDTLLTEIEVLAKKVLYLLGFFLTFPEFFE